MLSKQRPIPNAICFRLLHVTNTLIHNHCKMTRTSRFPDGARTLSPSPAGVCSEGSGRLGASTGPPHARDSAAQAPVPTLGLCLTCLVLDSPPSGQGFLSGKAEDLSGTSGAQASLPSTLSPLLSRERLRGRGPGGLQSLCSEESTCKPGGPARRDLGR